MHGGSGSVALRGFDGDAERSLVGMCITGGLAAMADALDAGVAKADFANERLATIWSVLVDLADQDKHIDSLSVTEALMVRGLIDAVGGAAGVTELEAGAGFAAVGVGLRSKTVINNAAYRRLSEAAQVIHSAAVSREAPADELTAEAQEAFLNLNQRATGNVEVIDLNESVDRVLASAGKSAEGAIPSGFRALDDMLDGGFVPGHLYLIAARPGMGKTAIATAIAANMADAGVPVGFFSLEVPGDDLTKRMISAASGVPKRQWGSRHDQPKVLRAADIVRQRPIHIIDTPGLTVSQVTLAARRLHARHGVSAIFVDHLGKMKPSDRYVGQKVNEIGEISDALRILAGRLKVPVIALSQLNRKSEERTDKRPTLSDLRDSGDLEQDASVVLFPFRPKYALKDKCPADKEDLCEVDVAKNRNGPCGVVDLTFDDSSQRFSEREQDFRY